MKINIKPNLCQFLTNRKEIKKDNINIIPISNSNSNFMEEINSQTNSNKIMSKFLILNSLKNKENKKISKIIASKNIKNYNLNNNFILKEIQNDCNNFRKSKTTDKIGGDNINLIIGLHENKDNNNNKKIMIKQNLNNIKKLNINISKIPKYNNTSFKKAMLYYTTKSENKTINIEELSKYLKPIKKILGLKSANKIKLQNNINSITNIYNCLNKSNNVCNDEEKNNMNNLNILISKKEINEHSEQIRDYKSIYDEENKEFDNDNNINFEKHKNLQSNINLKNKILNKSKNSKNVIYNNINNSLIKNCVFNNYIPYSHRNKKFSKIPFNIKIDKIDNSKNAINTNEANLNNSKTRASINNMDTTSNYIINSKNVSEIDTQISSNNAINNSNQESKAQQNQSQTLYQFRPRKMHLPKSGINLSSMQFKNQILKNILNKRRQNK